MRPQVLLEVADVQSRVPKNMRLIMFRLCERFTCRVMLRHVLLGNPCKSNRPLSNPNEHSKPSLRVAHRSNTCAPPHLTMQGGERNLCTSEELSTGRARNGHLHKSNMLPAELRDCNMPVPASDRSSTCAHPRLTKRRARKYPHTDRNDRNYQCRLLTWVPMTSWVPERLQMSTLGESSTFLPIRS